MTTTGFTEEASSPSPDFVAPLDLRGFVDRFGGGLRIRTIAKVHRLLATAPGATDLEQRLDWIERFAAWVRRGGDLGGDGPAGGDPRTRRLRFFVDVLANHAPFREDFAKNQALRQEARRRIIREAPGRDDRADRPLPARRRARQHRDGHPDRDRLRLRVAGDLPPLWTSTTLEMHAI